MCRVGSLQLHFKFELLNLYENDGCNVKDSGLIELKFDAYITFKSFICSCISGIVRKKYLKYLAIN
jgi:hypothetical protein